MNNNYSVKIKFIIISIFTIFLAIIFNYKIVGENLYLNSKNSRINKYDIEKSSMILNSDNDIITNVKEKTNYNSNNFLKFMKNNEDIKKMNFYKKGTTDIINNKELEDSIQKIKFKTLDKISSSNTQLNDGKKKFYNLFYAK